MFTEFTAFSGLARCCGMDFLKEALGNTIKSPCVYRHLNKSRTVTPKFRKSHFMMAVLKRADTLMAISTLSVDSNSHSMSRPHMRNYSPVGYPKQPSTFGWALGI